MWECFSLSLSLSLLSGLINIFLLLLLFTVRAFLQTCRVQQQCQSWTSFILELSPRRWASPALSEWRLNERALISRVLPRIIFHDMLFPCGTFGRIANEVFELARACSAVVHAAIHRARPVVQYHLSLFDQPISAESLFSWMNISKSLEQIFDLSLFHSFFLWARPFTCRKLNRVIFFIFSRMVFLSLSHSDSFFPYIFIYPFYLSACASGFCLGEYN